MGPRTLGPPTLGQKHLYCGFRQTTPESTPVPRTSQGLCHFHVFGKPVKNIDPPPWTSLTGGVPLERKTDFRASGEAFFFSRIIIN